MLQFPYLPFKPSYSVFYLSYYIVEFSLRFVLNSLRFYFQISVCILSGIDFFISLSSLIVSLGFFLFDFF